MRYLLLWNEESGRVYGYKGHFEKEEDFINQVKAEYKHFDGKECIVEGVKIEPCIETEQGLPGDIVVPLSATDVEIVNYYTADIRTITEYERKCRACGCTWNNACEGGCFWVEDDLCSKCVDK